MRVDADLTLAGSGYGLISSPAYTDYLAEALAEQIGDLLQKSAGDGDHLNELPARRLDAGNSREAGMKAGETVSQGAD